MPVLDFGVIVANDPIRQSKVRAAYDMLDSTLQPAFAQSSGQIVPDGVDVLGDGASITSTNWTEIDPRLSLTFSHDIAKGAVGILTVFTQVSGASAVVAEIGLMVDGVIDLPSVIRFRAPAATTGQAAIYSSFVFPFVSDVNDNFVTSPSPIGNFVIKPAARIISGTTPTIVFRFNRSTRFMVRDM